MSQSRAAVVAAAVSILLGSYAGTLAGQQIDEIQIAPVDKTMRVGERETFLATAYDATGSPLVAAEMNWLSTNTSVVQIEQDPSTPSVVTVTAVGVGVAQIEARAGGVRNVSVIRVIAGAEPAPADSALPASVTGAVIPLAVRIQPELYGTTVACHAGGYVSDDLILTTYTAIRGADRITVTSSGSQQSQEATVAAYDVTTNLAALHVPRGAGLLNTGADPTPDQRVWALAQPDCDQTVATSVQLSSAAPSTIDRSLTDNYLGAPLVDRNGDIVAIASGGSSAIPASAFTAVIATAIGNANAGTLLSASDVATTENHAYGALTFQSQVFGASARVTPLEAWQWSQLQRQGRLPLTFNGPQGRYRVELLSGGDVAATQDVQMIAGTTQTIMLAPTAADAAAVAAGAAAPPPDEQIQTQGGGGGVSPILLVGGGVVAVGGVLLLVAGGGGDGNGNGPPTGDPGTIRIRIPNPSGN